MEKLPTWRTLVLVTMKIFLVLTKMVNSISINTRGLELRYLILLIQNDSQKMPNITQDQAIIIQKMT